MFSIVFPIIMGPIPVLSARQLALTLMSNRSIRRAARKASPEVKESEATAKRPFQISVQFGASARSFSVSDSRFLTFVQLSAPLPNRAVRFRYFGRRAGRKAPWNSSSYCNFEHLVRLTHNPLVEGSSPSGPTTSHKIHGVMSLRPGDHSPLVHSIVDRMEHEFRGQSELELGYC
jgi:hypothetical protein